VKTNTDISRNGSESSESRLRCWRSQLGRRPRSLSRPTASLLADLIHNAGDALTAIPLAAALLVRSERAERGAGLAVVLTILASAITAGVFAILPSSIRSPRNTSSRLASRAPSA